MIAPAPESGDLTNVDPLTATADLTIVIVSYNDGHWLHECLDLNRAREPVTSASTSSWWTTAPTARTSSWSRASPASGSCAPRTAASRTPTTAG